MSCHSLLASLVLLAVLAPASCFAQEEEVLNKKRSEWLKILKEHKETKFRRAAIIALEVFGPKAQGVSKGLVEALEMDSEPEIRREIALTLGRMGPDAKGAAEALGQALKRDKADGVREAAALSLAGKLNEEAQTQVLVLADALGDAHAGTRTAAAAALKNMGEKAKPVLAKLLQVAQDKKADRFPRLYAIQLVSKIGEDGSDSVLAGIFQDKEAPLAIRQAALEGIGLLGEKAAKAIPLVAQGLKEKEPELRRAAAVVLGKLGDKAKEAWPAVKEAHKDTDTAVRHQLIRLAGALAKEQREAIKLLADAARSDVNLENRLAAIQELGQLHFALAEVLPILDDLAAKDARATVREAAQTAAKKIKRAP